MYYKYLLVPRQVGVVVQFADYNLQVRDKYINWDNLAESVGRPKMFDGYSFGLKSHLKLEKSILTCSETHKLKYDQFI